MQSFVHCTTGKDCTGWAAVAMLMLLGVPGDEGFGFGDAVGRDGPTLWIAAVLAREPRMPTDLEARLLQGSTLPH